MLRFQMLARSARNLAIVVLAIGLTVPLGTVLCVHDSGHASLETADLEGCTDTHDSHGHDPQGASSGRSDADRDACTDSVIDSGELRTAPATEWAAVASDGDVTAAAPIAPPTADDPLAVAFRDASARSRWVTAFEAALRTTVARC